MVNSWRKCLFCGIGRWNIFLASGAPEFIPCF